MNARTLRALQFATVQLVGIVAVIHIVVGLEVLVSLVANGLVGQYLGEYAAQRPRPLLFVPSGLAILVGLGLAGRGTINRRTAYQLGILAMGAYLLGWVGWHTVLNHGFALTGEVPPTSNHDAGGVVAVVLAHIIDPIAETLRSAAGEQGSVRTLFGVVAVGLELLVVGLLAVLLRYDPDAQDAGINFGLTLSPPER
ncbi:hypothetical protein [Halosegnis longus]|uniref:Uncharacterized protein n=1 Tax=Halosegnis longus TaxID=2216012 RepID=A0AAJ4R9E1_9EURY|nr:MULTISPECIES: hypothetical protein [Halobacteriales]RNJ27003.1 hypothetical protein Nmn1133_10110 [Salella cibi]